jgi:hypothetical protein
LTAFFRLGTVILESKHKEVCLIKPCRCSRTLKADLAFNQHGNASCPQERAIEFITSMLSRKKGRRYGEGHQKAPQISICMLPLARLRVVEGVICLPRLRHKRNAWHILSACLFFLAVGRAFLFPHYGGAGRKMMVYLVTKQLKYPLSRSSDNRASGVGRSHDHL